MLQPHRGAVGQTKFPPLLSHWRPMSTLTQFDTTPTNWVDAWAPAHIPYMYAREGDVVGSGSVEPDLHVLGGHAGAEGADGAVADLANPLWGNLHALADLSNGHGL